MVAETNVEYIDKIIPDAYHGTNSDAALCINEEGFKASDNERHYLGSGVYFFEASLWHASDWAHRHFPEEEAVIQATIQLGCCFDLNNLDYRNCLRRYSEELRKQIQKRDRRLSWRRNVTDAMVINFLAQFCQIDTVRFSYTQPDYGTLFEGSRVASYQCLIICVRNTDNIKHWKIIKCKEQVNRGSHV